MKVGLFSQVHVTFEENDIFELMDGRITAVWICNRSAWLNVHPDCRAEEYLERQWIYDCKKSDERIFLSDFSYFCKLSFLVLTRKFW